MSRLAATPTAYLDADLESADWTKASWDLPPYRSALFLKMFPDLEGFKKTPVYAHAVEQGLIMDDEWVGDFVTVTGAPTSRRSGAQLKAVPPSTDLSTGGQEP